MPSAPPKEIREIILKTGIKAWLKDPESVTASNVARMCGMTHGSVLYHFPYGVKDAVIEYALSTRNSKIIAQLIAQGHKSADSFSPSERLEYLKLLV